MSDTTIADKKDVAPAATTDPKVDETKLEDKTSHDPLDKELEIVRNKKEGRTKREKLLYVKNRTEEQLKELDEEEGIKTTFQEDDNKPLTVGMLKQMDKERAVKTAIQMSDDIADEKERELVKHHLENSIKPSGNPDEDLRKARAIVNAARNGAILDESARRGTASSHSSGSSAPAKTEKPFEPTSEELAYMRPPFNLSKDDILKARNK